MVKGKSDGHSDCSRISKNTAASRTSISVYYSRDEFSLNEANNYVVIYGNERDGIRELFSLERRNCDEVSNSEIKSLSFG